MSITQWVVSSVQLLKELNSESQRQSCTFILGDLTDGDILNFHFVVIYYRNYFTQMLTSL